MKNNKKIIALTISILLLFIFGTFLLPITKATETYTTIEEIEDFSCIDDTYIYSDSYYIRGNYPTWKVGFDESNQYMTFFKFNLSNKPENYIKAEVILTFFEHGLFLVVPCYFSNNSWNEEELTQETIPEIDPYPPPILPFSVDYGDFINVFYYIDITEYSEQQFLSFCLFSTAYSEIDVCEGYSKEHPTKAVRPKVVWTVKHEVVIPQNNEVLFLIVGLSIGLIVGLVAVGVIIVLNKRKSKI